jgi:hypothetical protein
LSTTASPLAVPPTIDLNDPRLTADSAAWSPPRCWDELTTDQQSAVMSLADLGLYGKATDLCTCNLYFIKILEYSNHWVRVGKATCHAKFACRNCGSGKMRAHRLWSTNKRRYEALVEDVTRTLHLTVPFATPAASLAEYRERVQLAKSHLRRLRRVLRHRDIGFLMSIEPDPTLRDVMLRLYYVGPDPTPRGIQHEWSLIAGKGARCTSKCFWDSPRDALKWMLDSSARVLELPGPERAAWEHAFQGYRMTSSCGSLRGFDLEDVAVEDVPQNEAAPYGYCPCGCGGIVTKSQHHAPTLLESLASQHTQVEFGPLSDYIAYRPKVAATPAPYYETGTITFDIPVSPPS